MSADGVHGAWVPVEEEPVHRELFRNDLVRVYEARIDPGSVTLDHRHDRDTVYVIVRGGTFRSDNAGRWRSRTALGRSVGVPRTLWWLLRRLTVGWLTMPAGTVLWQPHASYPLIHRVTGSPRNDQAVRMLGIELRQDRPPRRMPTLPGVQLEYASSRTSTYRLSGTQPIPLQSDAILTVIRGVVITPRAGCITAGATVWLAEGETALSDDPTMLAWVC
ncbi:MAG: hypothetical protein QM635_09195 [Microbacteriaceae bacterium]